jgi:signal transduction histidine kinase
MNDLGEQVRVGVMLDVTAQRQAEGMRRDRDRAESERRQMTQFLSRVSHELRTPLNAILGFAQLIETDPDTPAHQRKWVLALLDSGRHLLELVTDVLDLSGAQSGQMAVQTGAVDVAAVLREAWDMVRADADARGLVFGGVPLADGELGVQADRRRLLQVLTNLLSNAVKYNRAGGPVVLAVRRASPRVEIVVADGGPGMSAEQMARLFSPFDRLGAQHGNVPGTGLGLALSRQLAEAMGGSLEAASEPGQGCTFTLRLPAVDA